MSAATVKNLEQLPEIMTMRQVQEFLGLSRPKVYELANRHDFPVLRFGRALRVSKSALLRWLEAQTG